MVCRPAWHRSDSAGMVPSVRSVGEVSTQVGYTVIKSYVLELFLHQPMSDRLDSQIRKFYLVK